VPSPYENSNWPHIHWSWDELHLPKHMLNDRETINYFLRWIATKASGLLNQIPLNKNQVQELLLGVALFLRDLELCCFVDHDEVHVPGYIANSCIQADDLGSIANVVDTLLRATQDQIR